MLFHVDWKMCMVIRSEIQQAMFLFRLPDPEDEGVAIFRNVTKIYPNDTVKGHARLNSSPLKFKMKSMDNEGPQNVIISIRFCISSMSKCIIEVENKPSDTTKNISLLGN
jgi:hypothetical protein